MFVMNHRISNIDSNIQLINLLVKNPQYAFLLNDLFDLKPQQKRDRLFVVCLNERLEAVLKLRNDNAFQGFEGTHFIHIRV